ncbi:dynein regulatory complex subunit 4-like isoform X2 [Vanacampus margaritifer]
MPTKSQSVARRKAAKGKTSGGPLDVLSTEDMSKEQLEEHVTRLRDELEREREERSFFQLERDQIRSLWEVSKRHLDETQVQLRNRGREEDEADRRHRVEINVYKQKLKHVLSEQAAAAADKKTDGGAAAWQLRRRHADGELRVRRRGHNQQADARRDKLSGHKSVQELKLTMSRTSERIVNDGCSRKSRFDDVIVTFRTTCARFLHRKHQVELMELSNKYDKRVAELEAKYGEKTEQMRQAESDKTSAAILALEETMSRRLKLLTDANRQKFPHAQQFFSAAQSKLARDSKTLKEEASTARTHHARAAVVLEEAERDNARLSVSLQEAEQNLPDVRRRLEAHGRARHQQTAGAARVKRLQEQLDDVILERDLLMAAFAQVEEERDALLKKQTDVLLEVRQRSDLKEMLLERKMALLSRSVDRKEARLLAAQRTPVRTSETLESKTDAVRTLREDLERRCREYEALADSCRRDLDALGVPSSDFPLGAAALVLDQHEH